MVPEMVLQMVLILGDKWTSWAGEHFVLLYMVTRMIPELRLCYSNKITLFAPKSLHFSLRIHPWHSNASLLFISFNNLLNNSWGYHMVFRKVCLKFCYVFCDKITLTALLIRAVGFVVFIEVSP